jgi:hypothetical protein
MCFAKTHLRHGWIYELFCLKTHKRYIGSSENIEARFLSHRRGDVSSLEITEGGYYQENILEEVNFLETYELRAFETIWIQQKDCINKMLPYTEEETRRKQREQRVEQQDEQQQNKKKQKLQKQRDNYDKLFEIPFFRDVKKIPCVFKRSELPCDITALNRGLVDYPVCFKTSNKNMNPTSKVWLIFKFPFFKNYPYVSRFTEPIFRTNKQAKGLNKQRGYYTNYKIIKPKIRVNRYDEGFETETRIELSNGEKIRRIELDMVFVFHQLETRIVL